MKERLTDIESFLKGYKPALLLNPRSNEDLSFLDKFPSTQVLIYGMDQLLFFQDAQSKRTFQESIQGLTPDSPSYHKKVGLALGFPPKAVDFFVSTLKDKSLDSQKIGLSYCGFYFVSSISTLIDDVLYLWENVKVSDGCKETTDIDYNDVHFSIDFNDYEKLNHAYKELKKALDIQR